MKSLVEILSEQTYVPRLNTLRISQWVESLSNLGTVATGTDHLWPNLKRIGRHIDEFIAGYPDFKTFAEQWIWVRNVIPLQVRLFVEQYFWALGEPWKRLVSGFKPADLGGFGRAAGRSAQDVYQSRGSKISYPIHAQRLAQMRAAKKKFTAKSYRISSSEW